jgi:hypothetical protein
MGYTFVQCAAGKDSECDEAADWIDRYAKKHKGRVVTNFDEQRPVLADAPLSYQRLIAGTYERNRIQHVHFYGPKLADRIDEVVQHNPTSISVSLGDGTIVNGDVVVANSIRDSFKRSSDSGIPRELMQRLGELSEAVGNFVSHVDSTLASRAAEELETLTREGTLKKPEGGRLRLAIDRLMETARAAEPAGGPVLVALSRLTKTLSTRT